MTLKGLRKGKGGLDCKRLRRLSEKDGAALVRRAYDGGIRLFSASREYGETEERIALGLEGVPRGGYLIISGTAADSAEDFRRGLAESLAALGTEYIDIYCLLGVRPGGIGEELRAELLRAKESRAVRCLGAGTESLAAAREAIEDGLFGAVVYPLNGLSSPEELELAALAKERGTALFAALPMAGGLLRSAACAMAYLRSVGDVRPLWGAEYPWQVDELAALQSRPPRLTKQLAARMQTEREASAGLFCRGCGACMPCPMGIDIPFAARAGYVVHLGPRGGFTDDATRGKMRLASKCVGCGACADRCPFGLNVRGLIRRGENEFRQYMWELGEEWE